MLTGTLASCSSSSSSYSNTESLRIYELYVDKGTFTAVDGDTTATVFQLALSNDVPIQPSDEILYFTNRGAQEGGNDTVDNVMNNIWPRVYGSVCAECDHKGHDRGSSSHRAVLHPGQAGL